MRFSWEVISLFAAVVSAAPPVFADQVECTQVGRDVVVISHSANVVYALNGTARGLKGRGWVDGKTHYEPAEMTRLLQEGLANCTSSPKPQLSGEKPYSAPPAASAVVAGESASRASLMTIEVFQKAAINGDLATLHNYIEAGFNVNMKGGGAPGLNISGSPAINEAAAAGQCKAVDLLLASGAKADPKEVKYGFTPLGNAAQKGAVQCVRSLLAKGARVDIRREASGDTPLMLAAYQGSLEVVQVLVEHGASMKLTNKDGDNAYRAAVAMGNNQIALYLQSKGGR